MDPIGNEANPEHEKNWWNANARDVLRIQATNRGLKQAVKTGNQKLKSISDFLFGIDGQNGLRGKIETIEEEHRQNMTAIARIEGELFGDEKSQRPSLRTDMVGHFRRVRNWVIMFALAFLAIFGTILGLLVNILINLPGK